jgi:hypothetical protein
MFSLLCFFHLTTAFSPLIHDENKFWIFLVLLWTCWDIQIQILFYCMVWHLTRSLWRAYNLTVILHSSICPVVHPFASRDEGPRFNPQGDTYVKLGFPSKHCLALHWWPRRDWSLWPHLRQALSWTVTRPSCQPCDNPTWSHTALLSRFHARCRSSFQIHNHIVSCWGGAL